MGGDTPVVDREKAMVLTHPTVLHTYKATKQNYDFRTSESSLSMPSNGHGPSEDMPAGMVEALKRSPLGDHASASLPSGTQSLRASPCNLDMRGASRGSVGFALASRIPWQHVFSRENSNRTSLAKVNAVPFARLEDPPYMSVMRKEKTDPTPVPSVPPSSRPAAFLQSRHSFSGGE